MDFNKYKKLALANNPELKKEYDSLAPQYNATEKEVAKQVKRRQTQRQPVYQVICSCSDPFCTANTNDKFHVSLRSSNLEWLINMVEFHKADHGKCDLCGKPLVPIQIEDEYMGEILYK